MKIDYRIFGLLGLGMCLSALAAPVVTGNVDGILSDADGIPVLNGWVCSVGNANSVKVDVYVNQEYPAGHFVGRFDANKASNAAIADSCGTKGMNYRFSIPLAGVLAGVRAYAYGISPQGEAGAALSGSGNFKIPAKADSKPYPGSVSTATPFVLYDANVDANSGCAPFLDAPIYPVSFPTASNQEFELRLNVVSPQNDGDNYWIRGRMKSDGGETAPLHVDCKPILRSPHNPDEAQYSGSQWLTGFYKESNGSLYGIVHNEYYGGNFPQGFDFKIPSTPRCSLGAPNGKPVMPLGCTYTSLSMTVLGGGASVFVPVAKPPGQVVAKPGFKYVPNVGKATGYFTNTNIYKNRDGYYYVITADVLPDGSERRCPIRASDLSEPSTWKGWGGSDFTVDISKGGDCATTGFSLFPYYLGFNTYFDKFIIVGGSAGQIAYALSSDLVHWSQPVSFGLPIFDKQTADWSNNNYPSLMDPTYLQQVNDGNASTGAVTGRNSWLVFIQHKSPHGTRALVVPVDFSK
jgi:hypothetical protein